LRTPFPTFVLSTTYVNSLTSIFYFYLVKEYSDKIISEAEVQPSISEEGAKQYLDDIIKQLENTVVQNEEY
jgi:hypothetical protein